MTEKPAPDAALVGELADLLRDEKWRIDFGYYKSVALSILAALRTHDDTLEDAAKVAKQKWHEATFLRGTDTPAAKALFCALDQAIRDLKGKANG